MGKIASAIAAAGRRPKRRGGIAWKGNKAKNLSWKALSGRSRAITCPTSWNDGTKKLAWKYDRRNIKNKKHIN